MRHPDGLKGGPLRRSAALYGVLPPAENKVLGDVGLWNEGRIVVQGNHVEHWLNRGKALEYELGSAALMQAVRTSRTKVAPSFGLKSRTSIVLLDEGEEVAFRNLKIRALPALAGGNR
jgi:3-keto-disaccharide hydrolase